MSLAEASTPGEDAVALRLAREAAAATVARRFSRAQLGLRVAAATLEDVVLVVSELVSNAVLHGSGEIELRLAFDGEHVAGDVRDDGGGFSPHLPSRPSARVGGNGLYLVRRLTVRCGVDEASSRVWFEIRDRADPPPDAA